MPADPRSEIRGFLGGSKELRKTLALVLTLVAGGVGACAGERPGVGEQSARALEAERAGLVALEEQLATLDGDEDARVLIAGRVLDRLLAALDGHRFAVDGRPSFEVEIQSVRTQLRDGFPRLAIIAWAEQPATGLRVELSILAVLHATLAAGANEIRLEPRILSVVPKASWQSFSVDLRRLAERVVKQRLERRSGFLPAVTLPVRGTVPLELPAVRRPLGITTGEGRIEGELEIPAIELERMVTVRQILFLEDGLQIVLDFAAETAP